MKLSKVLSIVVLAVMLVAVASNVVLATQIGGVTINPNAGTAGGAVTNLGNKIIGIIQVVGTVTAVAVLAVLGIKYMMGSAEEKAEYKKTLMPYLIGAVLVLLAVNIVKWVADAAVGLF